MESIHKNVTAKTIIEPKNMTERVICQNSGKIATTDCENVRTEFFKTGTQPYGFCSSHIEKIESDISNEIENEEQGLNESEPGVGTKNPPAEGEVITPDTNSGSSNDETGTENGTTPGNSGNEGDSTDIGSQGITNPPAQESDGYWWSGDQ